jgi:pilus assembly protein Flp/PilA
MGDTRRGVNRMLSLYTRFQVWSASDEGATAVEYGILVSLIALAIIVAVSGFGTKLATTFTNASAQLK